MGIPEVKVRVSGDSAGGVAAIDKIDAKLDSAANSARRYGTAVRGASMHTANLTAQVNDIGLMLASGQSPFMLAAQQGTQVNQVLGMMGTSGTSRLKAVGSALAAAVSPANLLTFAIIAGGAALGQYAMKAFAAEEETDDLAKALEELGEQTEEVQKKLEAFQFGLGTSQEVVAMRELLALRQQESDLQDKIVQAENNTGRARAALRAYRDRLAVVQAEAVELEEILRTSRQTRSELERQRSARREMLSRAQELSEAERDIWTTAKNVSKEAEKLVGELGSAATKALILAGVDITSPISSAAKEAAVLAANLGIALNEALSLQNLRDSKVYGGRGGDPRKFGNLSTQSSSTATSTVTLPGAAGGGARSAGAGVDEGAAALESLLEELKTEREIVEEWRAESLELLKEANEAELEVLGGHNEARLRLEKEYQDRLSGIKDATNQNSLSSVLKGSDDILSAMGSFNSKALKLAQVAAAGHAWLSTLQGAAKELEKGTLGFATAAAVIAKGIGFIAAINQVNASSRSSGAGTGLAGVGTAPAEQRIQRVTEVRFLDSGFLGGMGEIMVDILNEEADRGNLVRGVIEA